MISKYFSLKEATRSNKADELGVDNSVDDINNMVAITRTAAKMDNIREHFNKPVVPTSWYRNKVINKAVGGVDDSQHQKGEAVDFYVVGLTPGQVVSELKPRMDQFGIDQLILEPNWVHVSFITYPGGKRATPRNQFIIDKRVRPVDIPKGLM